jgi:hypothetical protein
VQWQSRELHFVIRDFSAFANTPALAGTFFGQKSGLPVDEGRMSEAPLKRPVETGRVLIADGAGDFLDAQICVLQQVGGLLQSSLTKNVAKASAGLLLEQVLQAGSA